MEVEVRLKLKPLIVIVIACAAVALVADTLMSRQDYMESLPVYKRYKCAICHTTATPTSASLNAFGADFKANGRVWDATIAAKDSDKDGFPNGDELGDSDGDGVPDVGIERSNPGDRMNTPNSVDPGTWGLLKSLFED